MLIITVMPDKKAFPNGQFQFLMLPCTFLVHTPVLIFKIMLRISWKKVGLLQQVNICGGCLASLELVERIIFELIFFDVITSIKPMESIKCIYGKVPRYLMSRFVVSIET